MYIYVILLECCLNGFGYRRDKEMKKNISKIEKNDISFLIALMLFAIIAYIRFFDHSLGYHMAFFSIMQKYEFARLVTVGYFVVLFLMYFVCIAYCDTKYKKNMYYLIAFLSVFSFSMFLPREYFGTNDLYAWILTFLMGILIVSEKCEWMTIPLSFLLTVLSPMSIFNCSCIVVVLLLYKFFAMKNTKYFVYAILNGITSLLGVVLVMVRSSIESDAQNQISLMHFAGIIIMLSPYIYIAMYFFAKLFKCVNENKLHGLIFIILGALPSVVVNLYIKDYTRAIFYVFFYFISVFMFLIAMKDEDISSQMENLKLRIAKWVPIPAIIIAYPLAIVTLWISGVQPLLEETLLGK